MAEEGVPESRHRFGDRVFWLVHSRPCAHDRDWHEVRYRVLVDDRWLVSDGSRMAQLDGFAAFPGNGRYDPETVRCCWLGY